jgi:release factor glutamine methyltransferase
MIQIQAALEEAIQILRNNGVESPRLDAELLLAQILQTNRAVVLAWPERILTPKELACYRDFVMRRAAREPLAYIVGHREFYDLDLLVDSRVLIPRPETELLIERTLEIAQQKEMPLVVADVGSGSGAIAVTLAVHLPQATVYALDGSAGALAVTAENACRHGVTDRVHCLQGDLLEPLPEKVDLLTANLPYVSTTEWQELPPEIHDYEPRGALEGGSDGLSLINRLLATAGAYLRPGGAILLEIGAGQGASVTALARQHFPGTRVGLYQDYAGLDRLVVVET